MLINKTSKTSRIQKNISGIHKRDMESIKSYLQKAVDNWIKNKEGQVGQVFTLRDLVGGENSDWMNTPLESLHTKHTDMGKDAETAHKVAGQDAGKILKLVLENDKRKFRESDAGFINGYKWEK